MTAVIPLINYIEQYAAKNLKNTLFFKRIENGIIFSTKPLDGGIWVPFPMAQVIAYKHGHEVYRGSRHKGTFVPTLEYITAMDAMYIKLVVYVFHVPLSP